MSSLSYINYLNVIGYGVNSFVTFAGSPLFGFPDNAELSEKYQTLVTPAGLTFAVWGVIFVSQAVFAVVQMLEPYRSDPLVRESGASYWYFVACLFQAAWTFAFGYESLVLSSVLMAGILGSLIEIVWKQSRVLLSSSSSSSPSASSASPPGRFWLLVFPFSVHCGWIAAAFAVNLNVVVVGTFEADPQVQEYCAYATLVYAVGVAASAFSSLGADVTIPSVLVWATAGISIELDDPKAAIVDAFSAATVNRVRVGTIVVCALLAVLTAYLGASRSCSRNSSSRGTPNGREGLL